MTHDWPVRVYYEDVDLAGIVYYANYFRYLERARTEWVRALGIDQGRLKDDQGIVFAVRRLEAEYLAPARFDDLLAVRTEVLSAAGARIELGQDVWRGGARLLAARVTLVALGAQGRPVRLPGVLSAGLRMPGRVPSA